jgi:RecJ-like exonuclease
MFCLQVQGSHPEFFSKEQKKGTKQRIQEYPNFQSASSHVSGLLNQKFKGKKNTRKKGPTTLKIP